MKRLTAALLLLLTGPAAASELTGPAEVAPHTMGRFAVRDLPDGAAVIWDVYPEDRADTEPIGPDRLLVAAAPGKYTLKARVVSLVDGRLAIETLRAGFTVSGATPPPPDPDPDDDEDDEPDPPGPAPVVPLDVGLWCGVILRADTTPDEARLRIDAAVLAEMVRQNAHYRSYLDDEPEIAAARLDRDIAEAGGVPCLVIRRRDTARTILARKIESATDILRTIREVRGQ